MATRESMAAFFEEDDDEFEERISSRLSCLVKEATKLELELEKMKLKFETGENVPADRSEPIKPVKVQNVDDELSFGSTSSSSSLSSDKSDLTKWKYADLRNAINTSTDVAHLAACREEFHRRVKVYQAWKNSNKKSADNTQDPKNITQLAPPLPSLCTSVSLNTAKHRYFRIPFMKSNNAVISENPNEVKGLWYAHFDGQYIARQMEIFPNKTPLLFLAGKDDIQMCELTLDETGLVKKKRAEILEKDFETAWKSYGGAPFTNRNDDQQMLNAIQ